MNHGTTEVIGIQPEGAALGVAGTQCCKPCTYEAEDSDRSVGVRGPRWKTFWQLRQWTSWRNQKQPEDENTSGFLFSLQDVLLPSVERERLRWAEVARFGSSAPTLVSNARSPGNTLFLNNLNHCYSATFWPNCTTLSSAFHLRQYMWRNLAIQYIHVWILGITVSKVPQALGLWR